MNLSNRNKTMLILAAALFVVIVVLIFTTIFGGKDSSNSQSPSSKQTSNVSNTDYTTVQIPIHQVSVNQRMALSGFKEKEIYCTLQSITPYTNLNDAGITLSDLDSDVSISCDVGLDSQNVFFHPNKNNPHHKSLNYYVDEKTEKLVNHCYLLMMDVEITNVKARNDNNSWADKNVFTLNALPEIIVKRDDGGFDLPTGDGVAYFDQTGKCSVNQYPCFELNIGETKHFKVGYLVYDKSSMPLSKIGLSYVWAYPFNENNVFCWLDLYGQ